MADLGTMGELDFKHWCCQVDLVANGSEIDKNGWDFFVEFPSLSNKFIPQDMQPAPIECKVQVKATDKQNQKCQIKVSNLQRLIKTQMPSFFCFIEYDGKNSPQSAYLVHVGKKLIEKTLKRIRKLDVDGEADKLNKRTITIRYSEEDKLDELTGQCLKAKIESYIPDGFNEYIKQKNQLLKSLGFEDGLGIIRFTLSEENPLEKMIDLNLGIIKSMNVSEFESYHKRFGILSKEPFVKGTKGEISVDVKPLKALIIFKDSKYSPEISFQSYFYSFSYKIPKKKIKFRVKTEFFDLIVYPFNERATFNFSIDDKLEYSLLNINKFLKLQTLFRKNKNGLIIRIQSEEDDLPVFSGKIQFNEKIIDEHSYLLDEICEKAVTLCKDFSIIDKAMVSIESLFEYGIYIQNMYEIIYENSIYENREFMRMNLESEETFKKNTNIACVLMVNTIIGNTLIACFIAFITEPEILESNQLRLILNEREVGPKFIAKYDEIIKQEEIDKGFTKFSHELESRNITVLRMKPEYKNKKPNQINCRDKIFYM
jgi:hypothetical protein